MLNVVKHLLVDVHSLLTDQILRFAQDDKKYKGSPLFPPKTKRGMSSEVMTG